MANFRQRESGLWQATVRMTGYPSQSKTFERKIDAAIWARKIEADIDKGVFQSASDAEKTSLSDLIDRFKKEYAPFHYRKREDEKEAWRFQVATRVRHQIRRFPHFCRAVSMKSNSYAAV
ncbi:hypothetical protein [Rhodoferax sp.]|uniref:hypothetical protein n=1 Tax=Rhodoferax sp. TaxID=50421 RepID=UPI00284FE22D|nr:hypothetical protein [Rhodoferax sp.]MDR3371736.1 hypothetical protein [Rhodoferax sp.]